MQVHQSRRQELEQVAGEEGRSVVMLSFLLVPYQRGFISGVRHCTVECSPVMRLRDIIQRNTAEECCKNSP